MRILLGPEGYVLGVKALEGPRELMGPAECDIWRYRFKPVVINGKPVCAVTEFGFPYSLKSERVDPAGKPITGYVLHVDSNIPSWGRTAVGECVRRELQARLGALGLEARDAATADPDATLDVAMRFRAKDKGGIRYLDLSSRASLLAYRTLDGNSPSDPFRVWKFQTGGYVPPKGDEEKTWHGLLESVMESLAPEPGKREGELALLSHGGDPVTGDLGWDPIKVAAFTASQKSVDFDFSKIKIRTQPPAPAYPVLAKVARIQGVVVVELEVDPTGTPQLARALEGPEALREVAVEYALQWRFEPVFLDGVPQTVRFKLSMPFHLK